MSEIIAKIKPLADRLLVRPLPEDQDKSGILIPETVKEKPSRGEVVTAGPGVRDLDGKLIKMDVKKGDKILFNKFAGTELDVAGEKLLIMRQEDVIGTI